MKQYQTFKLLLVLATGFTIVACGGGGGGGGGATSGGGSTTPSSYWDMDAYRYVNGGNSAQSTAAVGDIPDFTVVAMSTATTTPSSGPSLGAYSGSSLAMKLIGSTPGVYTVTATDQLKQATRSTNLIAVESIIGIGVTTGASRYVATSGTVVVTKDANGVMHFTSSTPLNMVKTQDVLGGVVGASALMTLNIVDAY